jgi:uncharacterized protein YcbK (DUF882 family)
MRFALVAALLVAASVRAAAPPRFFIMGDGRLALVNAHTEARVDVQFRRKGGTYDDTALAAIRRTFRSAGDEGEGKASLRLIEILSYLQQTTKVRPLTLMSGYRSPDYNEDLRAKGARAAGGSLHTEGLAADIAFPRKMLKPLWMKVRAMNCCGAGYYAKEGFLHIDVGQPRFWEPQTSRVEENLSAGNARLFARTEFDRYAVGEDILVNLHAMTSAPVLVAADAEVFGDDGQRRAVTLHGGPMASKGCMEIRTSSTQLLIPTLSKDVRGSLVLSTCEPRMDRTPATIRANRIEIR